MTKRIFLLTHRFGLKEHFDGETVSALAEKDGVRMFRLGRDFVKST